MDWDAADQLTLFKMIRWGRIRCLVFEAVKK
jgi:hypothetical protein